MNSPADYSPRPLPPSSRKGLFVVLAGGAVLALVILLVLVLRGWKKDETASRSRDKYGQQEEKKTSEEKPTSKDGSPPKKPTTTEREPRGIYENIYTVQTWEVSKGPYYIGNSIEVKPGGGVRIERGTTILVAEGASLVVYGRLETFGDERQFVRFRSQKQGERWAGVHLHPFGQNKVTPNAISHIDVQGANVGFTASRVPVTLKRCIFAQNVVGAAISTWDTDDHSVSDCLVTNNSSDGLRISGKVRVPVTTCSLTKNAGAGLVLEDAGASVISYCEMTGNDVGLRTGGSEARPELKHCNIQGNRKAAIEVGTPQDIKCDRCWWATQEVADVTAALLDGRKTPGRGKVTFEPVWTMPFKLAGTKLTLGQ